MAVIFTMSSGQLRSQTIYATEFEEFDIGSDKLIGPNFWQIGNSIGTGSHGIDEDLVSGLGKSAFLGFREPSSALVTVAVSHAYDPLGAGKPIVEFESVLGVEDSSNTRRDTFSVVFLNLAGDLLASIEFRNSNNNFGLWYSNGKKITDSDIDFIRGELHLLTAQINFAENTWSAQLDGIDIIEDVVFHDDDKTLDLGFTGAQWNLSNPVTSNHGDNFLLIADWYLHAVPQDDFQISSFDQNTIKFFGEPGFIYRLQTSDDLSNWADSGPALIPDSTGTQEFQIDRTSAFEYYRVLRDFTPPLTE